MAYYLTLASVTATMTTLISATYALHRQKIAVERTLYARSAEESQLAARWARAWHKLVQRKLDQAEAISPALRMDYTGFSMQPAPRVLH
ncbi:hypothetical protein [Duganella sp. S19_KUP01_CR8]|uniref:hypothetical protein n=1 Tax=Duganella sp. S19_KUP01_CR8 TaxID=3025502 RepID=UPI002FCDB6E2